MSDYNFPYGEAPYNQRGGWCPYHSCMIGYCPCCCKGEPGPQGPPGRPGPRGPQGDTGPAGPQGATGATGPQGPIGLTGATGPAGPQGDTGPAGPQGEVGPAGAQGATGPAGAQGATGPAGAQGATGPAGPQGETGPAGPQGEPGLQGAIGPGASTIYLATDQSVSDRGWVGLGTSSSMSQFTTSTVTLPVVATITGLVFNIRDNTIPAGESVTATIYTSPCGFSAPVSTGISATILGPSNATTPNCVGFSVGSVIVTQGSLLSVQVTTSQGVGALSKGAAMTIFQTIP